MRTERVAWCEDVVKVYRTPAASVPALRGVSASFARGVLTAVVGPSGSGKSSLLRLLAALDRPTGGKVWMGDVAIHEASPRELRRLRRARVGYVFQRPSDNFVPHLTVGEHLRMGGRGSAEDHLALLERLGMSGRAAHLPIELSGGEQQRAAVAQVLAVGAEVVVADEPTAELDGASARTVVRGIRALLDSGVTFVVATHDPDVVRVADAVVELHHGRRRASGRSRVRRARRPPAVPPRTAVWSPPPLREISTAGEVVARLEGVAKTYRLDGQRVEAVREARAVLRAGEVVGLIGRSGSGKTTLLNLVAGWETPDAGVIDRPGGEIPTWEEVAVLPQRLGLLEELSVRENISYPARLAGRLAELGPRVDQLLEALGLEGLAARSPREISVGEQQRTAVARALVLTPRLLLADEPSGHQDAASTRRVFAAIREAAARGACALVATHDEEAEAQMDRVLRIADGLLAEG